ncbi:MAG: DNA-binding protein WhiA [Firmicutes bacterium]|nr:DNA-binding protein WhiA [Bacillota bacterium]
MSFSSKAKKELSCIKVDDKCCQLAELSAIFKMTGSIEIKGKNRLAVKIVTENADIIRFAFKVIKKQFNLAPVLMVRKKRKLKRSNIYILVLTPFMDSKKVLEALGILHESLQEGIHFHYGIDEFLIQKDCCKRSYLRGAFLGGGSLSDPEKTYHLEFICHNREYSRDLSKLINSFGLKSKIVERKGYFVVYLKEGEQISNLLNIIGAHSALLNMENIRVIKDVRNNINRLVNCETANMNKTIDASIRQINNINYIKDNIGLKKLSRPLQEIAELRLNYPDISLKELGEMLVPPISKSGVNHRLRKIEQIANKIRLMKGENKSV